MSTGSPNSDNHTHAALTNQHTRASPPRYTLESVGLCFSIAQIEVQISTQNFVNNINYLLFFFLNVFFSTFISIFACISSVIVARPTTPPIVHVPPESDSHEVAQTQVSREFCDS